MNKLEVRIRLYFTAETISQKVAVEHRRLRCRVKISPLVNHCILLFLRASLSLSMPPLSSQKEWNSRLISHTHTFCHQSCTPRRSQPLSLTLFLSSPYQSNLSPEPDSSHPFHPFPFAARPQSSGSGVHPHTHGLGSVSAHGPLNFIVLTLPVWVVGSFKHLNSRQKRRRPLWILV